MRIYLAGKIAKNDWRHNIVSGLRESVYSRGADRGLRPWLIIHNSIFGVHSYVGPYFISCDHGCYHGDNTHGVGGETENNNYCGDATRRDEILSLCLGAIVNCDVLFAWIDAQDAFGTFAEIGYAYAVKNQRDKPIHAQDNRLYIAPAPSSPKIWIAGPNRVEDLWFIYQMADQINFNHKNARDALEFMCGRPCEYLVPNKRHTKCKSCGAPIVWSKTASGKFTPLDLNTVQERNGKSFALAHWATCPNAESWRSKQ